MSSCVCPPLHSTFFFTVWPVSSEVLSSTQTAVQTRTPWQPLGAEQTTYFTTLCHCRCCPSLAYQVTFLSFIPVVGKKKKEETTTMGIVGIQTVTLNKPWISHIFFSQKVTKHTELVWNSSALPVYCGPLHLHLQITLVIDFYAKNTKFYCFQAPFSYVIVNSAFFSLSLHLMVQFDNRDKQQVCFCPITWSRTTMVGWSLVFPNICLPSKSARWTVMSAIVHSHPLMLSQNASPVPGIVLSLLHNSEETGLSGRGGRGGGGGQGARVVGESEDGKRRGGVEVLRGWKKRREAVRADLDRRVPSDGNYQSLRNAAAVFTRQAAAWLRRLRGPASNLLTPSAGLGTVTHARTMHDVAFMRVLCVIMALRWNCSSFLSLSSPT